MHPDAHPEGSWKSSSRAALCRREPFHGRSFPANFGPSARLARALQYFPPNLIQYANTLLKNKMLFGSDYPLITTAGWRILRRSPSAMKCGL